MNPKALASIVAVLCAATVCPAVSAERPPNVVLILVDDLGWRDLGCQGSTYFETPNVDALAEQGMRFTQAYAACAVCSPTRAAVLTGKYPARIGITDWIRPRTNRSEREYELSRTGGYVENDEQQLQTPANRFELDLSHVTLAERFKTKDYATAHVGKWHLGDPGHFPTDQGFDRNVGGCDLGHPPSYFDPYANRRWPDGIPTLPPRKEGEYLADREADECVAFIREHKDQPFLLSYWPYVVHTPLQAKAESIERFRDKAPDGEQSNPTYAAMVHSMDEAVGRITATLRELDLVNQTLIVFTSDNGGLLGPTSNLPLRSGKGYAYEGGLRVPLIVCWPGVVPAGATSEVPACSIDLAPTICEAAAIDFPERERDGLSLWKHLLSGGNESLDRDVLLWHFPHYRQGRAVEPYSIIRSGDWKLIKYYDGSRFELYNLAHDPTEEQDLSGEKPELVEKLDAEMTERLIAMDAKFPKPSNADRETNQN